MTQGLINETTQKQTIECIRKCQNTKNGNITTLYNNSIDLPKVKNLFFIHLTEWLYECLDGGNEFNL